MSTRIIFACCLISLVSVPAFSQDAKKSKTKEQSEQKDPKEAGLRKIASGRGVQDIKVEIDEEAIEAEVEEAVSRAMEDVEEAMEAVEAVLDNLDFDINIDIPEIDI